MSKNNSATDRHHKIFIHTLDDSSALSILKSHFNLMCNFGTPDSISIIYNMKNPILFGYLRVNWHIIRYSWSKATCCWDYTKYFIWTYLLYFFNYQIMIASYAVPFYFLLDGDWNQVGSYYWFQTSLLIDSRPQHMLFVFILLSQCQKDHSERHSCRHWQQEHISNKLII